MALTVTNLISQVRNQLDETNKSGVKDSEDVLPSLNRANDYALNILTRVWEPTLISYERVTGDGESMDFPIPQDAFEQRIEHVELEYQQNYFRHLTPADFREITVLEGQGTASYPTHWCIVGNNVRILPRPAAGTPIRIWYSKDPGLLVKEQARIVLAPTLNQDYLVCTNIGEELSEDMTDLSSYFNVVDGQTGEIKGTFQIAFIENNRIYIRTSGTSAKIDTRTVLASFNDLDIEAGDFVCSYEGTCIPTMKKPLSNFLVQFAVAEITRKLGGDAPTEEAVLRKFEEQVRKTWSGRNRRTKVTRSNHLWATPARRPRR